MTCSGVVRPEVPGETVEVRELPGVEDPGQHQGPGLQGPGGGSPADQRRHGSHQAAHPGVEDAVPLHGRVDTGVEDQVTEGEGGCQGVDQSVKESRAAHCQDPGEGGGVKSGDLAPDQDSVLGPVHLTVERNLKNLIDAVCRSTCHGRTHGGQHCRGKCQFARSHPIASSCCQTNQQGQSGLGQHQIMGGKFGQI